MQNSIFHCNFCNITHKLYIFHIKIYFLQIGLYNCVCPHTDTTARMHETFYQYTIYHEMTGPLPLFQIIVQI